MCISCSRACLTHPCSRVLRSLACSPLGRHMCSFPVCCNRCLDHTRLNWAHTHQYLKDTPYSQTHLPEAQTADRSISDCGHTCLTLTHAAVHVEVVSSWTVTLETSECIDAVSPLTQTRQLLTFINIWHQRQKPFWVFNTLIFLLLKFKVFLYNIYSIPQRSGFKYNSFEVMGLYITIASNKCKW